MSASASLSRQQPYMVSEVRMRRCLKQVTIERVVRFSAPALRFYLASSPLHPFQASAPSIHMQGVF